uniref:ANK_REP_REGION domain-containing protein n=1 Tax=Parastrongyloides trichosuri TaxID=131310 RepID=A0A0N4ZAS1_PARTI
MPTDLSFLGVSNAPNRKRYSIAAFPLEKNLYRDNDIESSETSFLDIFDKDEDGNTNLMRAIKENRPLAVQNIMKKAYTTNVISKILTIQNKKGENAIQLSSECSNLAIKEYLEGIKNKKINPMLENIKISTQSKDQLPMTNLNTLPEIIKPNMFGATEQKQFISTIEQQEQQRNSNDIMMSLTPRIRSISIAGEDISSTNIIQEYGKMNKRMTLCPTQDIKNINEVNNGRRYSTLDSGFFNKRNSMSPSKLSNASNASDSSDYSNGIGKPPLPKPRHIDGAIDVSTNFFSLVKPSDGSKQNVETSLVLMLSDKMKNFVKKRDGFQGYSSYDTQLLYMSKEQSDYEESSNVSSKSSSSNNNIIEFSENKIDKNSHKFSVPSRFPREQTFNNGDPYYNNSRGVKNRSQSLCKGTEKI